MGQMGLISDMGQIDKMGEIGQLTNKGHMVQGMVYDKCFSLLRLISTNIQVRQIYYVIWLVGGYGWEYNQGYSWVVFVKYKEWYKPSNIE